ncbi:MAG: rod shape-determining protein MreD [Actinobacteria bacterium]|nr:rod shape-determining protein MreD [Actinomycetota bacterium]
MRKQITVTLLMMFSFVLQFVLSGYLAVFGIYPNFILAAALCISLIEQPTTSMIVGFSGGILVDLISGGVVGLNAFTHTLSCYVVSISSTEKMILSRWKSAGLIYIAGVMNYSIIFVMLFLFGIVSDYSYFPRVASVGPIYNLFISIFILSLIRAVVSHGDRYGELERIGSFRGKI